MNEQAQRVALCEWAGWTAIEFADLPKFLTGICPQHQKRQTLPDTSSLDVLHEMRQRLTYEQRKAYTKLRWKISRQTSSHVVTDNDMWKFANFDAAQERECLLKTLNLWKEDV